MANRRGARPARQHEFLERRKLVVQRVEVLLESSDMLAGDLAVARQRELCSDLEQLVLNAREARADRPRKVRLRKQKSERAVGLVDVAERRDARIRFVDSLAIRKPSRAVVARAGVDLAEAVTHDPSLAQRTTRRTYGVTASGDSANRSRAPLRRR